MDIVTKFLSRKLLVVLIPIGLAMAKSILCESGEILTWKLIGLVGFYVLANVIQKVAIGWINAKYSTKG